MGRIIGIVNQKGGVGKTTTAVSLSAGLALRLRSGEGTFGKRVLLVDCDPQGNATTGLGVNKKELGISVAEILLDGVEASRGILRTRQEGLDLLPSRLELAGVELRLAGEEERERRLRKGLEAVRGEYDYIIIDGPPSLGLLTVNCLVAADSLIIPVQCEYYALEGLEQLVEIAGRVREGLNPGLRVEGMLLTMFDGRTRLSGDVVGQVRKHFGDSVFRTVIPRSVRLAEAPSYGLPVTAYAPESAGAIAYMELAREVEERRRGREEEKPEGDFRETALSAGLPEAQDDSLEREGGNEDAEERFR
jgi:chromosome partitioning protein